MLVSLVLPTCMRGMVMSSFRREMRWAGWKEHEVEDSWLLFYFSMAQHMNQVLGAETETRELGIYLYG